MMPERARPLPNILLMDRACSTTRLFALHCSCCIMPVSWSMTQICRGVDPDTVIEENTAHLERAVLDRGLELDGQVGVDAVVLEVVLLQHRVVQPARQAAGLDMLHLRNWQRCNAKLASDVTRVGRRNRKSNPTSELTWFQVGKKPHINSKAHMCALDLEGMKL
jgi:hypothetical protein